MEAGHELDALVAEKVMGIEGQLSWNVMNADETTSAYHGDSRRDCEHFLADTLGRMPNSWLKEYHVGSWRFYPRYSTDFAAAWTVVEKMRERGYSLILMHAAASGLSVSTFYTGPDDRAANTTSSETAPLSICLAALKAVATKERGI